MSGALQIATPPQTPSLWKAIGRKHVEEIVLSFFHP